MEEKHLGRRFGGLGGPHVFMNFLRAMAQTALGIWLGAIVMMAIVAPTTFSTMRTVGVERPNTIAGKVMARNFSRFDKVQIACAAVVVVWQMAFLALRNHTARDFARTALIIFATGLMLYGAIVMTPTIESRQADIAAPDSEAAVKAAFDAYHATAVRLAQAVMVIVLILNIEMAMPRQQSRFAEAAK